MNDSLQILVADDDRLLREILRRVLENAGHHVVACQDGREVLAEFRKRRFDVVFLDVVMPGLDGYATCQRLLETSSVPIIMLTSLGGTEDVVRGLEQGADDYLVKPFRAPELVARVAAAMRRTGGGAPRRESVIRIGDLEIDRRRHRVQVGERAVILSPTEFELLYCLAANAGAALDRQELLHKVWGTDYAEDTKLVDVCVRRLRQKLEADASMPTHVVTVRGVGYALAEDPGDHPTGLPSAETAEAASA